MIDYSNSFGRREVMLGVAGAAVAATLPAPTGATTGRRPFPKGFRWGCSTAGHQIEGNNVNSDLWLMENVKPTIFKERSGDACDSYHRFEEDIALLAGLGLNSYRFSIEWARIEPTHGFFSNASLDHYKRVIAICSKHKVMPVVTFFHVAAPRWFAEAGGWLNPDAPKLFADYCDRSARALGDGIGYACTINEPQVAKTYRSITLAAAYFAKADAASRAAHDAAAKATGSTRFVTMDYPDIEHMTPQLLAAHAQGFAAIKAARGSLPTGVTLNIVDFQPGSSDSAYRQLRQAAYGDWLAAAKAAGDFVGVQAYRQVQIPGKGQPLPPPPDMPFVQKGDRSENIKQPSALGNAVSYVYEETGKPIFVTENGIETENDERRMWYLPQALASLNEAMEAGVPVIGYSHWSLLDNFEWLQGYKPRFGLFSVDRETFKRTAKPSAALLGRIARANAI